MNQLTVEAVSLVWFSHSRELSPLYAGVGTLKSASDHRTGH